MRPQERGRRAGRAHGWLEYMTGTAEILVHLQYLGSLLTSWAGEDSWRRNIRTEGLEEEQISAARQVQPARG